MADWNPIQRVLSGVESPGFGLRPYLAVLADRASKEYVVEIPFFILNGTKMVGGWVATHLRSISRAEVKPFNSSIFPALAWNARDSSGRDIYPGDIYLEYAVAGRYRGKIVAYGERK